MVNHHTYDGALDLWNNDKEIEKLTDHLKNCLANGTDNSLWKHFSMTQQAEVPRDAPMVEKQMGYMIQMVQALQNNLSRLNNQTYGPGGVMRGAPDAASGLSGQADIAKYRLMEGNKSSSSQFDTPTSVVAKSAMRVLPDANEMFKPIDPTKKKESE